MAKAVIKDIKDFRLVSIKTADSYRSKVSESLYRSKVEYTVPFRVKFKNIGIEGMVQEMFHQLVLL